jgi:hypothetical protein
MAAASDSKTTTSGSDVKKSVISQTKAKATKAQNFWVEAIGQPKGAVLFKFTPLPSRPKASVWTEYRCADGKFLSSGSTISKPILVPLTEGVTKIKFHTTDQPDEQFSVIEGVAMRVYSDEEKGPGAAK